MTQQEHNTAPINDISHTEMQNRVITFIAWSNWILFGGLILAALLLTVSKFQIAGLAAGGLIATVNFHLLYRGLRRSLLEAAEPSRTTTILGKYYIRFIISGIIIFFLLSGRYVHPVGLLIGLSIVVASIFLATIREVTKLLDKEAI